MGHLKKEFTALMSKDIELLHESRINQTTIYLKNLLFPFLVNSPISLLFFYSFLLEKDITDQLD